MIKNYFLQRRVKWGSRLVLAALLGSGTLAAHATTGPKAPAAAPRPLAANDAAVSVIYTFGKLPTPAALPHAVQAVITNAGTDPLANLPVTLTVSGANSFTDVQTVASLAPGARATVTFAAYPATLSLGVNQLAVTVPADDNAANNAASYTQRVSAARLAYIDTAATFNASGASVGQAGGALAVKYTLGTSTNYLSAATATFAASSSASTQYQLLVYDATGAGGTPGTLLYTSPTRTRTAAAGAATVSLPGVQVGASFFVGLKELDNPLGLATQAESPLRAGISYFQLPGGAWTATASQTRRALEVTLGTAPTCPIPTAVTVTNLTAVGATVSFTPPGTGTSYRVIYGPVGFNPATSGTSVTATSSPVTLTGLQANTSYEVYVQATCGTAGTSAQAGPVAFRTACGNYTFPYAENFDGVTAPALPCGITVLDANSDGKTWENYTSTTYPSSAPNAMRYSYSGTNAANDWFFLPGLNLQAGMSYQLQFKYRAYSATFPEGLEVKVGNAATPAGQTTPLFTNTSITNLTYTTTAIGSQPGQVALFTPTASGAYYFGFHAISAADQYYLYVDDIQITAIPTPNCTPATNVVVSNQTATGASVSFTASSAAAGYKVIYGPVGFNPATGGTTVTAAASPVALTGLSANTRYDVYVQANCTAGGTSLITGPVSFSTRCIATSTFPYAENFDGVTAPALPCGITVLDANSDGKTWENYSSSTYASSAPNSMRYSYSGTNAANDWFFTNTLNLQVGMSYQLQFKYRAYLAADPEGLEVKVGSAATPAGQTTTLFTNTNIINTTYATTVAGNSPGQVTLFTPTTSGAYYVGFHAISTANQYYLYVDDVQVTAVPTPACPAPSALAVGSITATGASVSFSGPANGTAYTVVYGPAGFNPASGGISLSATTSPVVLAGLSSNTSYDVYVTATCGSSGASLTTGPASFRTACAPVAVFPYTESFDGVTAPALPCGITVLDANGDGRTWANTSGATYANSSPNAMRYTYSGTNAADDWFFTNTLNMQAGVQYQLQFKYRAYLASNIEGLEVKVGSAATVAGMATTVFTNTAITNTSYVTTTAGTGAGQVLVFTPTTSGAYYFGFHAISATNRYYLYVDDVQVTAIGSATCPTPTGLAASAVSATGATVSFTGPTQATGAYTVIYGPAGFNPASAGTSVSTAASPVTLTGLSASTRYDVYVRANCGSGGPSINGGPLTFTTSCPPVNTFPYAENFDGVAAPGLPCGVTVLDANNDGSTWENYNGTSSSGTNSMRYSFNSFSAADDWFFTPGLVMQAGRSYQLQFKYRAFLASYPEKLEVLVGTSNTPAGQTTTVFSNTSITSQNFATTTSGTGLGQVAPFVPATSGTYYFGFHAFTGANSFYLYVDDIAIGSAVLATRSSVAPGFVAEASPVPFGERLTLTLHTLRAGPLELTLHDAVGRVVRQSSQPVPAGASAVAVPEAGSLPAGVYLLTVRQGGNTQIIRVAHE